MKRALLLAAVSLFALNAQATVLRITVNDMIHPISDEYIGRALADAARAKDDAVIIELSTPGGLLESTRSIVEKMMTSRVPVIVYVAPAGSRAASAGFFLLEAADIAAMAPGTNTGAAHPVTIGGDKMDDLMKAKVENDAAAFMRTIATRRGRNVQVAESAVRESKSFTEDEALQQHLIDVVAPTLSSLLRAVDGRQVRRYDGSMVTLHVAGAAIRTYEMSIKERLLSLLMDPNIAFLLFALGALSLFAEFNHPGAVIPGVVGVISILLALFALNLLPTRYAALALLVASFILFALEAKYAAHGVLGIGGIICMIFGALLLVDGPIPEMRVRLFTALTVSIPIGLIAMFLTTLVLRARRNRVTTGREGMIGEIGIARTGLEPAGKVFVHGELWNAIARTSVSVGARVRVRAVDGLSLIVEPVETVTANS